MFLLLGGKAQGLFFHLPMSTFGGVPVIIGEPKRRNHRSYTHGLSPSRSSSYFLFPLALWLLFRFSVQRKLLWVSLLVMLSFATFWVGSSRFPTSTFYLLPTRAWEIGVGSILAFVARKKPPREEFWSWTREFGGLLGVALVIGGYLAASGLGFGVLSVVIGTSLIIHFGSTGLIKSVLSVPLFVFVGEISYSLYLWHWPILVFQRYFELQSPILLTLGIIFLAALLSYFLIEVPTRRRKGIVPSVLTVFMLTTFVSIALTQYRPNYDTSAYAIPVFANFYDLKNALRPSDEVSLKHPVIEYRERLVDKDAYRTGGVRVGKGGPDIVVLGDSHGVMFSSVIEKVLLEQGKSGAFNSMGGQSPLFSLKPSKHQAVVSITPTEKWNYDISRRDLIENSKPEVVIVCRRWSLYCREPELIPEKQAEIEECLRFISANCGQILLIEQPPELAMPDRSLIQHLAFRGVKPERTGRSYFRRSTDPAYEKGRALIKRLEVLLPNCSTVPTADVFNGPEGVVIAVGRELTYIDDDHLSEFGASLVKDKIRSALERND